MSKKITKILSIFFITLGIISISSVNVYAGVGTGSSSGTGTGSTEGGDVNNGNIGGKNDSSGGSNSGGSKGGSGSSGGSNTETPPKPTFYDYTDDWGNWKSSSIAGYYEDEDTYILIATETLDVTKAVSKTYDWTLDYKQKVDDTYKQIEHKVNTEKEWIYKVQNGGYYKMIQIPIVHYVTTTHTRQETTKYRLVTAGKDEDGSKIESSKISKREVVLLSSIKTNEYDKNGSSKKWEGYYYPGDTIDGDEKKKTDQYTEEIPVDSNLVK